MKIAEKRYWIENLEYPQEQESIFGKKRKRCSLTSDHGAVLILSLWVLVIVSLLVSGLAFRSGIDMRLAHIKLARARADEIARSTLRAAAAQSVNYMLEQKNKTDYVAYSQKWMVDPEIYKEVPIVGGAYEIAFAVKESPDEEPATFYGAEDEQSRININTVVSLRDKNLAKRIIRALLGPDVEEDLKTTIAGAIIDWVDSSEEDGGLSEISGGGAEDSFYRGEKLPYEARDGFFKTPYELMFVRGMTREIFYRLEKLITVYGNGEVNINTASREVLLALGNLGAEFVERIMEYRAGDDERWGTDDDGIFTGVSGIENDLGYPSGSIAALDDLRRVFDVNRDIEDLGVNEIKLLGVSSDVFRLNITATVQGSPLLKHVTAVYRRVSNPKEQIRHPEYYQILYWNEF